MRESGWRLKRSRGYKSQSVTFHTADRVIAAHNRSAARIGWTRAAESGTDLIAGKSWSVMLRKALKALCALRCLPVVLAITFKHREIKKG